MFMQLTQRPPPHPPPVPTTLYPTCTICTNSPVHHPHSRTWIHRACTNARQTQYQDSPSASKDHPPLLYVYTTKSCTSPLSAAEYVSHCQYDSPHTTHIAIKSHLIHRTAYLKRPAGTVD
ncbi:hypothetical protein P692DRAFT_20119487 [Suillus brevipes Sb2]|nr:hypothetical protein P692DRAFT_20119487 [Suillus brevipes Sb2]